jgi:hypothetical protein
VQITSSDDIYKTTWNWSSHLAPLLAYKLYGILSGSSSVEGTVPRSNMPHELKIALERVVQCIFVTFHTCIHLRECFQASVITEGDGWPRVFEDAIVARWNHQRSPPKPSAIPSHKADQAVSAKIAQSVAFNLNSLRQDYKGKQYAHILSNIQLAASYFGIMTLVCYLLLCTSPLNTLY